MTHAPRPLLMSGPRPADGLRLAGQGLWFDRIARGTDVAPASALTAGERAALTDARADICGVSMDRPRIMGIVNVTPDSFSDGGQHDGVAGALAHARAIAPLCDIIDVGGESTRPGAPEVPVTQEIARTAPVIAAIREAGITTPISIDTRKAAVAEAALDAGADIVNDVAAFEFDPDLADLVAERGVPVCLMHAKGLPEDMQNDPRYGDVVGEVYAHLAERIAFAESRGIARARIIADPGIGFGKTVDHNLSLIRDLAVYHGLGVPLLLGASRKSVIGHIAGEPDPVRRMPGSVAVALAGAARGAQILRVHDVRETAQALALWAAIEGASE